MEIHNLNDLFKYIEEKKNRKLSQAEMAYIRCRMIVMRDSVQNILTILEIGYSDAKIS